MKMPKNVLHDIDMATNFENDVSSRYETEVQNHNVTPLMKYLHKHAEIVNDKINALCHKYNWSDEVVNLSPKEYENVKHILATKHLTLPEYNRLLINAIANDKTGILMNQLLQTKHIKHNNEGND